MIEMRLLWIHKSVHEKYFPIRISLNRKKCIKQKHTHSVSGFGHLTGELFHLPT